MDDFINNYVAKYGMPNTYTVKTRRGGYHLYFNYDHSDKMIQDIIDLHIINKTGYRNSSIDVRSNGGYVVAAGSFVFDEAS